MLKIAKQKDKECIKKRGKQSVREQGITLVALVITIIIIIILATVTINMAFGENGLITQAKKAKDMTLNSVTAEQEGMNSVMSEYLNVMAEDEEIQLPDLYVDSVLPSAPKLSEGMTPVKYEEGTGWVKTNEYDSSWYNYANKEWANIVLGDATFIESGDKEILDEEKAYSMLVWIPRYAYQITSGYHQSGAEINPSDGTTGAGNINIVFIDTENKNKAGTTTYSEEYPNYATGSGMEDYVVHPAFNYGGTKLSGFWVGKYETSHTGCTTDVSTGETDTNVTTLTPMIKAGVTSWRNITVSNAFTVCIELNKENNPYGLNTKDNVVDPHMMKNTEWGAVAYLSQNTTYGKGSEVWINPNSNYITGQAGSSVSAEETTSTNVYNTSNGQQASTTGNVTGIYDMSGGTNEYIAAFVNNGHLNLTTYGKSLIDAEEKYKELYQATSSSANDSQLENYNLSIPANRKYGDAIYETSCEGTSNYLDSKSWYLDYSYFPCMDRAFFLKGGFYSDTTNAGVFYFGSSIGAGGGNTIGFRIVLPVY